MNIPPTKERYKYEPEVEPPDEGDSNWIISYADMMTLLMSFFAIMFSFSKVDSAAFDEVRSSVAKQFGGVLIMPFETLN